MPTKTAEDYLAALADELAITEGRYEQASKSYASLGDWLHRPDSTVFRYDPQIYAQGSFRLGTAIRPLSDEEEYDVDSVCELRLLGTSDLSQKQLKKLIGDEIKAYHRSQAMVKPPSARAATETWRWRSARSCASSARPAPPAPALPHAAPRHCPAPPGRRGRAR